MNFFDTPTESEIEKQQAETMSKLEQAAPLLEAIKSSDNATRVTAFRELGKMGYAQKKDGRREGEYYWELTSALESDREYVAMTPKQIVARFDSDPR